MTLLNSRVIRIVSASVLGGILIGVVGGGFRYLLITSDNLRGSLIAWAHRWPHVGWLLPIALGAGGAWLARLLVLKFALTAEGSGVQRVEAVFSGEAKPASASIVPVKFFGGIIAMGSGLALGREGPTVQMGASFGSWVSRFLLKDDEDRRVVDAASAGAGLAVAFNAPIGGSIFVFEELTSSFTPWLLISTLAAATVAVWLMRVMLGNALDFPVPQVSPTETWNKWPFLALGALLGLTGAIYNAAVMGLLRISDKISNISSLQRAAIIGAVVGLVAWFVPAMVGGGDTLTQASFVESIHLGDPYYDISGAFRSRPVVLCRGRSRRSVCPIAIVGSLFGSALCRSGRITSCRTRMSLRWPARSWAWARCFPPACALL